MTSDAGDLVAAAEASPSSSRPTPTRPSGSGGCRRRRSTALVDADLMRMALPAAYGGPEADPLTMLTAIEIVARADGAAGWCTMIASTTSSQALFLPPEIGRADLRDADDRHRWRVRPERCPASSTATPSRSPAAGSGGAAPSTASGSSAACGATTTRSGCAGSRRPTSTFHDTWYTSGLRGTGSLDFSVDGVVVPLDRTMPAVRHRPRRRRPARRASRTSRCSPPASPRSAWASPGGRSTSSSRWPPASGRSSRRRRWPRARYTQVELARGRSRVAVGAGVPPRRGRHGVGPGRRRRAGRRAGARRDPPRRRQRRGARRRGRRHGVHPRRRLERLQRRACSSAACATPTSRPSTCRSPRSSTRPSVASSSTNPSTPPP